jgi:hypothetical protein
MEATHIVRITIVQFLVDRVADISKQENLRILFCIFWVWFSLVIIPDPEV